MQVGKASSRRQQESTKSSHQELTPAWGGCCCEEGVYVEVVEVEAGARGASVKSAMPAKTKRSC